MQRTTFLIGDEMLVIDDAKRNRKLRALCTLISIASFLFSFAPSFAQTPAARPEFDVASVRRNLFESRPWLVPPVGGRFKATNVTLRLLIGVGWPQKVSGGPSWVVADGYDVSAVAPKPDVSREEFSLMMQNLLKDRFALRVHTETRAARVYVLLPAKNGLGLRLESRQGTEEVLVIDHVERPSAN